MNFEDLINQAHKGANNWRNFGGNNFDADLNNFCNWAGREGLTAFGFDADIANYGGDSALGYMPPQNIMQDKKALGAWLDSQVSSGAMTTYKMRTFYTAGAGVAASVDVTYFAQAFNTGTFSAGGDLEFTNAGGDTATIRGVTKNLISGTVTMENFMFLTQTEPFTLGFIRMRAKSATQLENAMDIIDGTQFGGAKGNSITPDDYINPDQYQFLRVDVPFNIGISKKKGFKWTIDEDQTGTGVSFTLFIPTTIDPEKALKGESQVRVLNGGNVPPFSNPNMPANLGRPAQPSPKLIAMASNPLVKSIIGNANIPRTQAISMIRNMMG